jgi:hypothetical protein
VPGDNSAGHPHVEWLSDPAVLAPLALMAGIYVWRFRQARREAGGRGAGPLQAAAFAGAMIALLAALVSPIDGLGEDYLFSAHMVQHVLLGDIAPLLLLLALSRVIMRPATRRLTGVERALGPFASPVAAIALWLGLMASSRLRTSAPPRPGSRRLASTSRGARTCSTRTTSRPRASGVSARSRTRTSAA